MISEVMKKCIDSMDYESMLRLWRFAPIGHPMFQGELGQYYAEAMNRKREEVCNEEQVRISKEIGW
jgi:hypothetical protein